MEKGGHISQKKRRSNKWHLYRDKLNDIEHSQDKAVVTYDLHVKCVYSSHKL